MLPIFNSKIIDLCLFVLEGEAEGEAGEGVVEWICGTYRADAKYATRDANAGFHNGCKFLSRDQHSLATRPRNCSEPFTFCNHGLTTAVDTFSAILPNAANAISTMAQGSKGVRIFGSDCETEINGVYRAWAELSNVGTL
jgi:hypothetical protein